MTTLLVEHLPESKPMRKRIHKIVDFVSWTVLILIIALVGVFSVYVRVGDAQVSPVLSGSMEPTLMTGDIAITHKVPVSSLKARDIIIFYPPDAKPGDHPKVHRIITLKHIGPNKIEFTTKGDHNTIPDPWGTVTTSGTAYKVVFDIPKAGWLINGGIQWIAIGVLLLLAGIVARWTIRYLRTPTTSGTCNRE